MRNVHIIKVLRDHAAGCSSEVIVLRMNEAFYEQKLSHAEAARALIKSCFYVQIDFAN